MKRLRWIWQGDVCLRALILLAVMASVSSFAYFYSQGLITVHPDSQARLMIARRVIDGLHTGLAQLGGVWLPLPQVAMLPLIWNDFLYSSGIAGTVLSMVSYVASVVFLYKLIVSVTEDKTAGLIGAITFSGPNILAMQPAPMSDIPFIAFFVMSVYFLMRWVQDVGKIQFLFFTAGAVFFATLTRYEGWVLFLVVTAVIVYTFWKNRFSYAKAEGHFVFFVTLALFGVGLWLVWNQVIFGDVLYFARSEYSASGLIKQWIAAGRFPEQRTAGNFLFSFLVYGRTVLDNAGWISAGISGLGLVCLLFARKPSVQKLVALILMFPFVFYVLGMFEGTSVLVWHPDFMDGYSQNLRYGMLMLPAVGFFVGFLTQKRRSWLKLSILVLVVSSAVVTWQGGIISLHDAFKVYTHPDTQVQRAVGKWLNDNYDNGLVLMQRSSNEHAAFVLTLSLCDLIYEGDQDIWEKSLQDPIKYARWVFMRTDVYGQKDKVWVALQGTPQLTDNYDLVYQDGGVEIYKRKSEEAKPIALQAGLPEYGVDAQEEPVKPTQLLAEPIPSLEPIPAPTIEKPKETYYTVVHGDWLYRIARTFYGDQRHWQTIYEANQGVISNPNLIRPGQVLLIPNLRKEG